MFRVFEQLRVQRPIRVINNEYYKIINANSGEVLDVTGAALNNGIAVDQ